MELRINFKNDLTLRDSAPLSELFNSGFRARDGHVELSNPEIDMKAVCRRIEKLLQIERESTKNAHEETARELSRDYSLGGFSAAKEEAEA